MPMKKLTASDPETRSLDLVAENVEQLKALFPELVTEGPDGSAVNVEVLKQLVGDKTVTEAEEKYGLNWHGKRRARQHSLSPSAATLRPRPDESNYWNATRHLFVEGDNLESLKLLAKAYSASVDIIYIDPPYNTGHDFVYPDHFASTTAYYLQLTGQSTDKGAAVTSNPETSGRYHTDWLSMMLPRVILGRQMLKMSGVIMVSIDDREVSRLRLVLDEVFGEDNFVGALVWQGGRRNAAKVISTSHDYILVYARNLQYCLDNDILWRERKSGLADIYAAAEEFTIAAKGNAREASALLQKWYAGLSEDHPSSAHSHYKWIDARGVYFAADISRGGGGGPSWPIVNPETGRPVTTPERGWAYSRLEDLERDIRDGLVHFNGDGVPCKKSYLKSNESQLVDTVFYKDRRGSSKRLRELMGADVFDFPKDETVLARLFASFGPANATIMDFFAGSGSSAHAVLMQNAVDDGGRRYILIQLPEPLDPSNADQKLAAAYCDKMGKPRNIAELTKERLRRAAKKIKDEKPQFSGDLGFRVFRLDSSNIREWEPVPADLDHTLLDHLEHLKADRTEQDILYELLLKLGLDLCVPIESKSIAGKAVHNIGGGVLVVCLAAQISRDEAEPLAQGIAEWHRVLAPAGDTTCVFRDSAFADDVTKTNLAAILEQVGIVNVRSL